MKKFLLFGACVLGCGSPAFAGTLIAGANALSGTTFAAEPWLAGATVEDERTAFSIPLSGGQLTGTVQSRVLLADDNTYDFYWRIYDIAISDTAAPTAIRQFRLGEFGTAIAGLNGNYRTDGFGDVGPYRAYVFTGSLDSYVNFQFEENALGVGDESLFFFLDTEAKNYARTAIFDVTAYDGQNSSSSFTTFGVSSAPSVPEPATWGMLILGFAAIGGAMRRDSRRTVFAQAFR